MSATIGDRNDLRNRVTAALQWGPARDAVKRGVRVGARARAGYLATRGQLPEVGNIFTASCPKSGSQWIKALFHHPIVRSHTRLLTLPQLDYQQAPVRSFPGGTFVPGLYLSYDEYRAIRKPHPHRTVYIFRDPRDILVSGYFSGLETHREIAGVAERRQRLRSMPIDEGLMYALRIGERHLRDMASWIGVTDPAVHTWRLEDVNADPAGTVPGVLAHCGVHLDEAELATVLADTSREALQKQDLAHRRAGSESHYRVRRQGFRELLKPQHYEALERIVPGVVEALGYPPT